ncbi:thioesterase family protein [Nonomuraea basaltis]|uniref:thioesterase family protein n=1 Tax=Nonomuraea basaltis TaxID=2495887 RepID=UPI00110C547A|nr:thioesterase family protein [Nonomuraea basaltis]TMR90074.1 thioesterase [Nonomuraea basaltis]
MREPPVGLEHEFTFPISESKIVPALYPESPEFAAMPPVLATGFLVGLLEWTCVRALVPYLDWPREQTVGTHIAVSHQAATPPGLSVTCRARLTGVDGRHLAFEVNAHDGHDLISTGIHERAVIDAARFTARVLSKGGSR